MHVFRSTKQYSVSLFCYSPAIENLVLEKLLQHFIPLHELSTTHKKSSILKSWYSKITDMLHHKNITWGMGMRHWPDRGKAQSFISSMARKNSEQAVHLH